MERGENPCDAVTKVLDCNIVVSEFKFQSPPYYVHFWTNFLGKGMNLVISPVIG